MLLASPDHLTTKVQNTGNAKPQYTVLPLHVNSVQLQRYHAKLLVLAPQWAADKRTSGRWYRRAIQFNVDRIPSGALNCQNTSLGVPGWRP
jgi:hypothetical protein